MLLGDLAMPEAYPDVEMANISVKYTHEQGKFIVENTAPHVDYGVHPKGIFFIMISKRVQLLLKGQKRLIAINSQKCWR